MGGKAALGQWVLCLSLWTSPLPVPLSPVRDSPALPPGFGSPLPSPHPALRHIEGLVDHLLRANHSLLQQDLPREQISLILEEGDRPLTARSNPETGEIRLSATLLRAIQTDDELAFILSHELAHLWLKHPLFEATPQPIQRMSVWQTQAQQCQRLHRQLRVHHWAAEEQSLQRLIRQPSISAAQHQEKQALQQALLHRRLALQRWLNCRERLNQWVDQILGEAGAVHNWTEAEADAVGLDLFLNAGFDPAILPDLFRRTKGIAPKDCPSRPDRGSAGHPTPCWRLRQLEHRLKSVRAISARRRAIARRCSAVSARF
jgi:hypothetical protein